MVYSGRVGLCGQFPLELHSATCSTAWLPGNSLQGHFLSPDSGKCVSLMCKSVLFIHEHFSELYTEVGF